MLTFLAICIRSLRNAGGVLAADILVAYGISFSGFRFIELLGDLMLLEVAILFIAAGLLDFSSSIGAVQFRKVILGSKEAYSRSAHSEAEKRAVVFFMTGLIIFMILIGIAIINRSLM
jgi:hypothetical protein